ncbi:hypothetical protein ACP70R_003281 [Stipagrostis hirtigluma subsp. patula]
MASCLGSLWRRQPVTELETTTSAWTTEAVRRKHVFEIKGYRGTLGRATHVGQYVQSAAFEVGGHDWAVRFFPRGDGKSTPPAPGGYASAHVVHLTPAAVARASCDLILVRRRFWARTLVARTEPTVFRHGDGGGAGHVVLGPGTVLLVKRSELETPASAYVGNDNLRIECVVTVYKYKKASLPPSPAAAQAALAMVPPHNLSDDLVKLLQTKEGADVTFEVEGELFKAHAMVLATRSPVFKAELYGPMREERRNNHITIEDMQPDIFRAMLRFIYTDSIFPGTANLSRDENKDLIKHLLVAADRYDVQGLKFICEMILSKSLDVETVAAMFALADQHNCSKLQEACVEFINSLDRLDDVVASKGYRELKSLCPAVLLDLFEKAADCRKI